MNAWYDYKLIAQAPVQVPASVQEYVNQAEGGFVSIVVLPRHVKEATLDEFTWSLLSFHDHVQYHVKCFKVNAVPRFALTISHACQLQAMSAVLFVWCVVCVSA